MFNENNIVKTIKKIRLHWAENAMMSQNSLLKSVLEQNPVGKKPIGRPKLRLKDIVKGDVEELGGDVN